MNEDHPEFWHARGIGNDHGPCVVTGQQLDLAKNIAGFVRSREAGERVVALFDGKARLDFRPHEPDWIQVKVCAAPEHEAVLDRLYEAVSMCGYMLSGQIIAWARDPEGRGGWEPFGVRLRREAREREADVELVEARVNAAAEVIWTDFSARMGGPWDPNDHATVAAVQTRATARAAIEAAAAVRRTHRP